MRVTLLLLALLVAGAFAQLPTGSIRCNATLCGPFPAVQCTLCADGTLGGCYQDACIVNDAGGCSWYRRPPCSSTPAPGSLGTTKPPCSDLGCNNTCPYGRVSINGCITCTCAPAPPQCLIACTDPSCNLDTQVYVPPGPDACCGTCQNKPSGCSVCPSISCPPSTATTTYGISVDACGCKTCVALDCSGVVCPDPKCVAPQVAFRTADGCCPVCRTPPTCPSTACPALACADGYHSIVRDGDCCPSCVPNPPPICPDCVLPTCVQGTRLTQVPGTCCPVCLPVADCTAILCPATTVASLTNSSDAACNPIFLSNREGACCKVCSPCRRNEAGLIRCDVNDQPVCAPGIATGDGNTCTPVPNPNIQQACKEFTVTIKQSDATVGLFAAVTGDNDQNRRIAKYALLKLILANAPAAVQQAVQDALEHLSVTILGRDGDQVRIKVCWTAATGDSTVDTTALATSTEQALTTAGVQTAGAAVIVPAVLLIFAAAIAML